MSELSAISSEIQRCTSCRLAASRTMAVPGSGAENAQIVFIGEAPGFHEDRQGKPFVGAAGNFLNDLLASINLARESVYITNVVKCRPPNNRDPQPDEIEACAGYLERQLAILQPRLIVTLGRFSMQLAFKGASISRVHGTPRKVGDYVYYPMFHPAAALHQPRYRSLIEEDVKRIPEILMQLGSVEQEAPQRPEQLSLF